MDNQEAFDFAKRRSEALLRNVQIIAKYSSIALVFGLLFSVLATKSVQGDGILFVAALACVAVGAVFGFLFGIPRSAQSSDEGAKNPAGSVFQRNPNGPRDNTNLEQISDWLVKILIGASLVQLQNVKAILQEAAASLNSCLQSNAIASARHEAVSAVTNGIPILQTGQAVSTAQTGDCTGFCLFFIIYFLVLGFLASYLITRLWLPYVMLVSNLTMIGTIIDAENSARSEAIKAALVKFKLTGPDAPPKSAAPSASRPAETGVSTNDPNKGKFGGEAERAGLQLTGKVDPVDGAGDYFRLTLKVTTDGSRKLDKPVTFHLHPTFDPQDVKISPVSDTASLIRASWGAFTVGATVEGEDTRLELDLSLLPDAPDLFKSR